MPSSCVVTTCTKKYNHEQDVSFHKFPTDQILCKRWVEFSGRTNWEPTRWSSICSRHFEQNCFKDYLMRKILRPDAIPTLKKDNGSTSTDESMSSTNEINIEPTNVSNGSSDFNTPTEEVVITCNSEYGQENDFMENDDNEENDETLLEHESELERFVESLCRLCAGTFVQNQLVSYSSLLNLIIKCFPTLNLENYEYFPKQICTECREKLISFSIFIDKTMAAQNYLTDKLVHNLPNISENFFDNKKILPRIKQEPIVVIKEEKIDRKIEFNAKGKGTLHGMKDKITFKDSKHCEIIEIVNLNTPLIDLRQHRQPSSPKRPADIIQPGTSQATQKRVSTPQIKTIDDDIEILSPTPLKVEEIIEGDEGEENRIQLQVPVKIDHNYSRPPYTGKIEILEERVFKTEVTDTPFFNSLHSTMEDTGHDFNRLCTICNFIFDSSTALKQHNIDSHSSNVLEKDGHVRVCSVCLTGFKSVYKYLQHKHHKHKNHVSYECRFCGKYYVNKNIYMKHIRYNCEALRKQRKKKIARNEYFEEVVFGNTYEILKSCQNSKNMPNMNAMELIEAASKKEYLYIDGPIQENITVTETGRIKEVKTTERIRDHKICSKCGRIFTKRSLKIAHEAAHRPTSEWDSSCSFCNQLFDHKKDLYWHIRYTCSKVQELKSANPSHALSCSICGASVSSLWNLKNHENIHTKKVLYYCSYPNCKKSCVSKQNLAQHKLTHIEERNYQCHLCENSYKRAHGLTQHINAKHMNYKPHVCPVCKKSYVLKTDMARCKHSLLKFCKGNNPIC